MRCTNLKVICNITKLLFQMRFPLFFLMLFLIFSCKEKPELKMDIQTVNINLNRNNNQYLKEYHPEKIGQEVEIQFIKNKNNNKLYGIMSCSYNSNFILDNNDFSFETFKCDSNFPVYIKFEKNTSEKYKLLVTKNPNSKSKYFKIGYKKNIFPGYFDNISVPNPTNRPFLFS